MCSQNKQSRNDSSLDSRCASRRCGNESCSEGNFGRSKAHGNTHGPAVRSIDPEKDSIVFFSNLKLVDHYVAKFISNY